MDRLSSKRVVKEVQIKRVAEGNNTKMVTMVWSCEKEY